MTILEQKFNNEMLIQYDQFVKDIFFLCQYVIFIKIMTDFFPFWRILFILETPHNSINAKCSYFIFF